MVAVVLKYLIKGIRWLGETIGEFVAGLVEKFSFLFDKKELTGSSIVTFTCKKCKKPFKIEFGRVCYFSM